MSSHTRPCKNPSEDKGATKTEQESPFSHLPSSREEAAAHPAPPKLARCTVRLRCRDGDTHLPELWTNHSPAAVVQRGPSSSSSQTCPCTGVSSFPKNK